MADPVPIEFGTGSHPGLYGPDNGPRHINVRMGLAPEAKSQTPYYSYWGTDLLNEVSSVTGGCRGLITVGNAMLGLFGTRLVQIDRYGNWISLGGIPGTAPAILARNQADPLPMTAIVSDGVRYLWTGAALTSLDDPDLPSPNSVCFLNQRMIYGIPDGRFFWTDVGSAFDVNSLSFAEAEADPDGGVRVFNHRGDLWYFGTYTTQIFRDTGQTSNTFAPVGGGYTRRGCASAHTVAQLGDEILWLADNGTVQLAQGYQGETISSEAVQASIKSVADKSTITAAAYYYKGLGFYEMSAPGWTWVFNRTTKTWFEAQSNGLPRRRTQMVEAIADKVIMGDYETGAIYELSDTVFAEGDEPMVWELRSPPWHAYPNRVSCYRAYFDFVTGVGLNSGVPDDDNAKVMIDWSDDGGRTFGNVITRKLGTIGTFDTTVEINGLGATSRQGRIWRLRISSKVPRAMMGGKAEASKIGT